MDEFISETEDNINNEQLEQVDLEDRRLNPIKSDVILRKSEEMCLYRNEYPKQNFECVSFNINKNSWRNLQENRNKYQPEYGDSLGVCQFRNVNQAIEVSSDTAIVQLPPTDIGNIIGTAISKFFDFIFDFIKFIAVICSFLWWLTKPRQPNHRTGSSPPAVKECKTLLIILFFPFILLMYIGKFAAPILVVPPKLHTSITPLQPPRCTSKVHWHRIFHMFRFMRKKRPKT